MTTLFKATRKGIAVGLLIGLAYLVGLLYCLYLGWCLSILWNWFVSSTFHTVSLSAWQAAGILTTIYLVLGDLQLGIDAREKTPEEEKRIKAGIYLGPLVTLMMGWVIHMILQYVG